jgi:hypothetical protein
MKPRTESTSFGAITIDGRRYPHDVLIRLDGTVEKRKKKLSKRLYGTSHTISRDEAEFVYEPGAAVLVVGTGQYDQVRLSDEAKQYLDDQGVALVMRATPEAVRAWNDLQDKAIALFHVTC